VLISSRRGELSQSLPVKDRVSGIAGLVRLDVLQLTGFSILLYIEHRTAPTARWSASMGCNAPDMHPTFEAHIALSSYPYLMEYSRMQNLEICYVVIDRP